MPETTPTRRGPNNARNRWRGVREEATNARQDLGCPPLVATIRQMIATQAVYNVIGGERYATVTQELKDYLQGRYGRPPVPADHEPRRLVLGREEPITIRPADLLEPQVENARQQVRKLGYDPSDDTVLIHLMFPNLAPAYMRGPQPEKSDGQKPVAAPTPPPPAEAAPPAPADEAVPGPVATGSPTAEVDVEGDREGFQMRVSGAGLSVVAAPAGNAAASAAAAPAAPPVRGSRG